MAGTFSPGRAYWVGGQRTCIALDEVTSFIEFESREAYDKMMSDFEKNPKRGKRRRFFKERE